MDAVMSIVMQVMLLAILLAYFALVAAAGWAVIWFAYHVLHDHWSVLQTWREARHRLFDVAH